jgi:hypothetical protein
VYFLLCVTLQMLIYSRRVCMHTHVVDHTHTHASCVVVNYTYTCVVCIVPCLHIYM